MFLGRGVAGLKRLWRAAVLLPAAGLLLSGCHSHELPTFPANYREYAYITNSGSDSVSVLDVANLRQDRTIAVGKNPTGVTVNPKRREVYVVNSGSGTVSVINGVQNTVAATIPVGHDPYSIDVDKEGRMAYVANSGSNNVSVLDLAARRQVGVIAAGEAPGVARISPDGNSLVITNRASGTVTIADPHTLKVRSTFGPCPGVTDAVILPDSSKAFAACSGGHQVIAIALARKGPEGQLLPDSLLTFLDVGKTPVSLALKPDGGEIFVSNFDSDTVSEIATYPNEVGGAYLIGSHPVRGIVTSDNSLLYVSDFNSGQVSVYSIVDGQRLGSIRVGEGPDALAFSAEGHLLFVADAQSGDVAAIRMETPLASLLMLFPVGRKPADIAVESFSLK
jgi:YVTN family beta-propeller protein